MAFLSVITILAQLSPGPTNLICCDIYNNTDLNPSAFFQLIQQTSDSDMKFAKAFIKYYAPERNTEQHANEIISGKFPAPKSVIEGLKKRIPSLISNLHDGLLEGVNTRLRKQGFSGSFGSGENWTINDYIVLKIKDSESYDNLFALVVVAVKGDDSVSKVQAQNALALLGNSDDWKPMAKRLIAVAKEIKSRQ